MRLLSEPHRFNEPISIFIWTFSNFVLLFKMLNHFHSPHHQSHFENIQNAFMTPHTITMSSRMTFIGCNSIGSNGKPIHSRCHLCESVIWMGPTNQASVPNPIPFEHIQLVSTMWFNSSPIINLFDLIGSKMISHLTSLAWDWRCIESVWPPSQITLNDLCSNAI